MPGSNYDAGNYPRTFETLADLDVQERRLHTILRGTYALLDELRKLEAEVMPSRIDPAEQSNYDTHIDSAKTGVIALITALKAIDALPSA
jgi:hypothetical protein